MNFFGPNKHLTTTFCVNFLGVIKTHFRLLHKQVDPQYAYIKAYSNRVPLAVFVNLFTSIVRVLNDFY